MLGIPSSKNGMRYWLAPVESVNVPSFLIFRVRRGHVAVMRDAQPKWRRGRRAGARDTAGEGAQAALAGMTRPSCECAASRLCLAVRLEVRVDTGRVLGALYA
jgi:hypothetical protein